MTFTAVLTVSVGERNERHYIVATQDAELQKKLRDIPGQLHCKCKSAVVVYFNIAMFNVSTTVPHSCVSKTVHSMKEMSLTILCKKGAACACT